jgi:hypothetical protein
VDDSDETKDILKALLEYPEMDFWELAAKQREQDAEENIWT